MSLGAAPLETSLAARLWTYQGERFPLHVHGPVIAALAVSSLGVSALLCGRPVDISPAAVLTAFVALLGFFLQLRIADEFKDYDDDLKFRPTRAVPRGLVSLGELRFVGAMAAMVQFLLALWLDHRLLWLLLLVWTYLGLMSAEFFVKEWLKARPLAYLASHMIIVPLIVLFATACDWLVHRDAISALGLAVFLLMSMCAAVAFEFGRKIRAPRDEEQGVETYSGLWGIERAAGAWIVALVATAASGLVAASLLGGLVAMLLLTGLLGAFSLRTISRFLAAPSDRTAKPIETISGLWTLLLPPAAGVLPWVMP